MRSVQRGPDLTGERQRAVGLERAFAHSKARRSVASHVTHREVEETVRFARVQIGMTFGWFSDAAIRDSCRNRSRNRSLCSSAGASTFSATTRPSRSCSARYTTPMPPSPSTDSMR